MKMIKVVSSLLIVAFFVLSVSIAPGNGHFVQWGAQEVWAAAEQTAIYSKYSVTTQYVSSVSYKGSILFGAWTTDGINDNGEYYLYSDYIVNEDGIRGSGDGVRRLSHNLEASAGWWINSSWSDYYPYGYGATPVRNVYKIISWDRVGIVNESGTQMLYNAHHYAQDSIEAKGALIYSGITAVEGTYPNNGKHSDGYWYVKVTSMPQIILTSPSPNGTLYSEIIIKKEAVNIC